MRIANSYNHLNARQYLLVDKPVQYDEIQRSIQAVNANQYLKISCDATKLGQVFYSQSDLNEAIKILLNQDGWVESRIQYYVTGDEETTREVVNITDKEMQKDAIEARGFQSYSTFNQVDFQKDRVAVEVQFGKYFSVAYDLHVKHTFFYSRNDIDVGIEIIPTKLMEDHMDTGVAWFENEVTNVIREGRTNPPVPILILGIEPDVVASKEPTDYTDAELIDILAHCDIPKIRTSIQKYRNKGRVIDQIERRIAKIEACFTIMGV